MDEAPAAGGLCEEDVDTRGTALSDGGREIGSDPPGAGRLPSLSASKTTIERRIKDVFYFYRIKSLTVGKVTSSVIQGLHRMHYISYVCCILTELRLTTLRESIHFKGCSDIIQIASWFSDKKPQD